MLPGSMLPPGVQMAAMDRHEAACENEEEYAQKHGRVVRLPGLRARAPSRARMVLLAAAVIITLALVAAFV